MIKIMLEGKTALITGASKGIGQGIAVKFANHGAFIGINYKSDDNAATQTLKLVEQKGSGGILLKGDVSNQKDAKNIVETLVKSRKQIDVLVNNAGIYMRNQHNLAGFYYLTLQARTALKKRLGGSVNFIHNINRLIHGFLGVTMPKRTVSTIYPHDFRCTIFRQMVCTSSMSFVAAS